MSTTRPVPHLHVKLLEALRREMIGAYLAMRPTAASVAMTRAHGGTVEALRALQALRLKVESRGSGCVPLPGLPSVQLEVRDGVPVSVSMPVALISTDLRGELLVALGRLGLYRAPAWRPGPEGVLVADVATPFAGVQEVDRAS